MATSWFGPWRMEIQKMDFPDPNYQIDLSIFADFSFIFQNEKKWKCAKEFLQRCKIVGVSPKEFIAILTPRPGQVQFGLLDWNPWKPKHRSIFKGSQFLLMWDKARNRALLQYHFDLHPPSCRWKWARSVSAGPPWRSQDGTANRSIHPLKRPFCHHFSFPASF